MKKTLFIISTLLVLLWMGYLVLPYIIVQQITDFEPHTFESVLNDSSRRANYGIGMNSKPEDYGFQSEEINFQSFDGIKLNSWYIPCKKPSNRSIVFVHGRTSNRLKTMTYLALIDSLDLDTMYNVFIPDLRNSGRSQASETFMGYKFAEDLAASLIMLNTDYQQDTFLLYGFSMGAMAIMNVVGRNDLLAQHGGNDVFIEKIILDSPLANVKETLRDQAKTVPLAPMFFDQVVGLYSEKINNFGDSMKMSFLLNPNIPTLILQSKDDHLTRINELEQELNHMKNFKLAKTVFFEGPDHVRMFPDARTRVAYIKAVHDFLSR